MGTGMNASVAKDPEAPKSALLIGVGRYDRLDIVPPLDGPALVNLTDSLI